MKRITSFKAATGIAVTSLFVALGGPAQAASLITGANVKNSSLTGADVKNSSLTGADVKGSSLTGSDVRTNSLSGSDITGIRSGDVTDGSLRSRDFAKGQIPAGGDGASANRANYLVVSPRNSDGSFTSDDSAAGAGDNDHKRFSVILSGSKD